MMRAVAEFRPPEVAPSLRPDVNAAVFWQVVAELVRRPKSGEPSKEGTEC